MSEVRMVRCSRCYTLYPYEGVCPVCVSNVNNPDTQIVKNFFDYCKAPQDVKRMFTVKKVIFNAPATIVLWGDGTKTVVQCGEKDAYDPEKGLAMAVAKKAFGNSGRYYNTFKKYLPKTEEASDTNSDIIDIRKSAEAISDGVKNIKDELNAMFGAPKDDET